MGDSSTIRLTREVMVKLEGLKIHHRETYEDVIRRLIDGVKHKRGAQS